MPLALAWVLVVLTYPLLYLVAGVLGSCEFIPADQKHWIDVVLAAPWAMPRYIANAFPV